ncbi:hypothetical protein CEXT_664891 [Caerostris extrusa]|uniref:Uncharacterized protein n=1 Tax=Caerostris extrusa TaxID=172846 RepID=A0AAV4XU49_CAEEX|nr:hypothetical protein CEXT_664891 [Caerostris extrusa]
MHEPEMLILWGDGGVVQPLEPTPGGYSRDLSPFVKRSNLWSRNTPNESELFPWHMLDVGLVDGAWMFLFCTETKLSWMECCALSRFPSSGFTALLFMSQITGVFVKDWVQGILEKKRILNFKYQ